ncbi:MAG TPA: MBL fold metallo-hydrolase [Candidatus Thermoplasmatota archaeon]
MAVKGGEYATEIPQPGSWREFMKWRRDHKKLIKLHQARGEKFPAVGSDPEGLLRSDKDSLTWAGHASTILRVGGHTILSDPVWSNRVGVIIKRLTPPSPAWHEVPPPDLITISHNHYDHLDSSTIRRVKKETRVAVPKGVGAWFRKRRFRNVEEFDWWQTKEYDGLSVTFVPSRHFSGRTLWDRNKSLFGGWILEANGRRTYHSGDTGYFAGFREIGQRFPGIDIACLPIGAYLPRWIMQEIHTDPDEAGRAFRDLGAKRMLPIHWGTFRLSDEAMDAPPETLRAHFEKEKIDLGRLLLPDLGSPIHLV